MTPCFLMNFTPQSIKQLLPEVLQLALRAGLIIKEQSRGPLQISHKGPVDLVTQTDIAVEKFLAEELGKLDAGITFLGEEGTAENPAIDLAAVLSRPTWIIDPVDGTTNYAHGLPFVATSIGLWDGEEIVLGVVNCPLLDECFYAVRGMGSRLGTGADERGSFAETTELRVSGAKELSDSLLATGFPYEARPNLPIILKRLEKVLPETQGLRRCGAAAIDLAYVAAGRFDAYYEEWIKPWDTAAGWLLVEEAGGLVGGLQGEKYGFESSGIIAANPDIYPKLVRAFQHSNSVY